ncbi:MAG: hypothetical protein K0Q58_1317 [Microbacterium sp.]|nr:hypothetical protein [Microbacterium sp.]
MAASRVCAPTAVARTLSAPSRVIVPPVTVEPGPTSTGADSPVSMLSSTAARPSTTTPSVAIAVPGRATNSSPVRRSPSAIVRPSARTTSGCTSSPSARRAAPARRRERCSMNLPSRRKTVTAAATSKYTSAVASCTRPNSTTSWVRPIAPAEPKNRAQRLRPKAAPVPRVIRVSIVSAPCRRFAMVARWNGHPPQRTIGAVRTSDTHCHPGNCHAGIMPIATTGRARARLTSSRVRRLVEPGASSTSCTWPPSWWSAWLPSECAPSERAPWECAPSE